MKIRNISIWLTENCNFNCTYCYEKHNPIPFDLEAVKTRIMRLFQQGEMDLQAPYFGISFFGGEPLLEFDNICSLISWLEQTIPKPFHYGITTNGSLITPEIASYLASKNMAVLFSIDGDRDAMVARSDSYDVVVQGLLELQKVGISPEANMTLTLEQLPRLVTNATHIVESLGFKAFNCNPLEPCDYDFTTLHHALLELYDKYLTDWLPLGVKTSALSKPWNIIHQAHEGKRVSHGCGAGKAYISIGPTGEVYPCHKMLQIRASRLSNGVLSINKEDKTVWESFDPRKNEKCIKCPIVNLCPGSCAATNATTTGDFYLPTDGVCTFYKARHSAAQTMYFQATQEQIMEVLGIDTSQVC